MVYINLQNMLYLAIYTRISTYLHRVNVPLLSQLNRISLLKPYSIYICMPQVEQTQACYFAPGADLWSDRVH